MSPTSQFSKITIRNINPQNVKDWDQLKCVYVGILGNVIISLIDIIYTIYLGTYVSCIHLYHLIPHIICVYLLIHITYLLSSSSSIPSSTALFLLIGRAFSTFIYSQSHYLSSFDLFCLYFVREAVTRVQFHTRI